MDSPRLIHAREHVFNVVDNARPRMGRDFTVEVTETADGVINIAYVALSPLGDLLKPFVKQALEQNGAKHGQTQG